jgi:signal transduction histidine kinase
MKAKSALKSLQRYWEDTIVTRAAEWRGEKDAARGWRNRHLYIIAALMVLCIFQYYIDQTSLTSLPFFNNSFFTGVHDVNRALFLIPIVYAALVFRVRGSLITSLIFLAAVLPRALFFSSYPNPLFRALVFFVFAALIGLFIAAELNRFEKEKKTNAELQAAYKKLNEYTQQLKDSQEQLIQSEKLSSLGQLSASIAHEVNNPLSGVLNYTQLLIRKIESDRFSTETARDYLAKMESELIRSTGLVRNLLDFARQSAPTLVETDLNDVVNRVLDLTAHSARINKVEVIKELDPSLPKLTADPNQLQQVFTNLVVNAIQAMPQGGKLTLSTSHDGGQLKLQVRDTGYGISAENMRKLFTPFFSTKKEVKGVGLGLAISYGIIQRHRGKIDVQSEEGKGTTFTVYLPVHHEEGGSNDGKETEGLIGRR